MHIRCGDDPGPEVVREHSRLVSSPAQLSTAPHHLFHDRWSASLCLSVSRLSLCLSLLLSRFLSLPLSVFLSLRLSVPGAAEQESQVKIKNREGKERTIDSLEIMGSICFWRRVLLYLESAGCRKENKKEREINGTEDM